MECVPHERSVRVEPHEHCDVARVYFDLLELAPVAPADNEFRPRGEERDDVGREVGGNRVPSLGLAQQPLFGRERDEAVGRLHDPQPQGSRRGRTDEARPLIGLGGADRAIGDVGVPELRVAKERVVRLEQRLVAAPVDVERPFRLHRQLRQQVGVDVRTTERVDRLLGVADQDQGRRGALTEGARHDLPLHGVGVLELVDQDDVEALPQPCAGGRAACGVRQGVAEAE